MKFPARAMLQSENDVSDPTGPWPHAMLVEPQETTPHPDDTLQDAYSRTVSHVARTARPSVAHITVRRRDGSAGAGSGFVFTPDGFLLTNSHVVHDAREVIASFANGMEDRA